MSAAPWFNTDVVSRLVFSAFYVLVETHRRLRRHRDEPDGLCNPCTGSGAEELETLLPAAGPNNSLPQALQPKLGAYLERETLGIYDYSL